MHQVHIIATWLHVISAVYWVGAILFTLTVLGPVMRRQPAATAVPILSSVQNRVRRFVLAGIVIFVVTGFFNLHYRGFTDFNALLESPYGRTFLMKMAPVMVMFAIYFSAPFILKKLSPNSKGTCCEVEQGPQPVSRVFAVLHMIALVCGLAVVYLGVEMRG